MFFVFDELPPDMYPEEITSREEFAHLPEELTRGGSCIVDPIGNYVVEPMFGEETIIYAELNLDKIAESHFQLNCI